MFGQGSTAKHLYNTTNNGTFLFVSSWRHCFSSNAPFGTLHLFYSLFFFTPILWRISHTSYFLLLYAAISRGMSTTSQFTKFHELSPYGQPPGTKIRAKIVSKFPPKVWEKNGRSGKLLGLIITDGESKTKATIFSGVDEFDAYIQQGKTYAFTNFMVRTPANMQYHNFSFPYEINFSEATTYEEIDDSAVTVDLRSVKTVPLDMVVAQLKAYSMRAQAVVAANPTARAPTEPLFNVLGVLVGAAELNSFTSKRGKAITKREIEVVDGSMTKIKIILWGDVAIKCTEELAATRPIVLIQGISFNYFSNSVTISSDFDATIDYNPDIETARALAAWYKTEGSASTFVDMPSGTSGSNNSRPVLIASINDNEILSNPDRPFYYTITGTVTAIRKPLSAAEANEENARRGGELYYNACASCKKKVPEDSFSSACPMCNAPLTVTKRYIMSFAFADGSGQRWLTSFADEAEKIIGISADELASYRTSDPDQFERILADTTHRSFNLRVKARVDQRDQNSEYGPSVRLSVVSVTPIDYVAAIDEKLHDIEDMMAHNFNLDYIF